MSIWTEAIPYFSKSELACKGTGIIKIDVRFAVLLSYLRMIWGEPLTATSVCRTPNHNRAIGGHPTSLHLTENPKHASNGSMAADITWSHWTKEKRIKFARLAYSLGFSVGLHVSFIHIDLRSAIGLKQNVFVYGVWNNEFGAKEIL